jgi:DNA-binding CsgD family transcriptional regulator
VAARTTLGHIRLQERDGELARIERWLRAVRGGRGGLLSVEGPAGIGKSALLASARAAAGDAGLRVVRARGAELEREFPFGIVRQLFEPVLAELPDTDRAAVLQGAAGIAARLLALPGAATRASSAAADPSFAVLHGLYWLSANLAASRPLLLVVDDAHWADMPSLRFLAFLQPRLEELPVAVLLAARPGEATGAEGALLGTLSADAAVEHLAPQPLSESAVGGLLAAGLGRNPEPAFVAACHRATAGNPFLVGQLVAALAEDGVAPSAEATARIETLGARWAARWILVRLGRLPAPAQQLARALAVLEHGELAHAAALAGLEADTAVEAADALAAAGILTPGRPLWFAHPIVRAGVYSELGTAERAASHRRAARVLADAHAEHERVAEHLLAADPVGDLWVVDRLVGAARDAARSGAPELAAVYLGRALEEPPRSVDRSGLLLELGVAEDNAGDAGGLDHMRAAVAAAEDERRRLAAAVALGHALARDNRFAEALDVIDRALESAAGEPELMAAAETLAASIATFSAATAGPNAGRTRAARRRADGEAPTREQLALAAQLSVRANEPAEVGAALARRALAAGRANAPEPSALPWFHQCAITLLWTERFRELSSLLDDAVASARERGDAALFSGALAYRGWLALRRGEPRVAEADTRTAIEAEHLPAPRMYRLRGAAVLVEALVEQGALERADEAMQPLDAEALADTAIAAPLRVARGRLLLAQRRPEAALADFLAAGEVAERTGLIAPACLPWRSAAARAQLELGAVPAAGRLAAEELALARAFGAPRALGVALVAAGLAAGDERLLREAVTVLERADARVELARALYELGAHMRRAGRRADARTLLGRALDLAHRAGAGALAARADTELRASGAKPRRIALSGLEALTASERRVAELAAEGLTNRQIAQALFVTMRTVEGHLTRVFGKLELRSRDELAGALAGTTRAGSASG